MGRRAVVAAVLLAVGCSAPSSVSDGEPPPLASPTSTPTVDDPLAEQREVLEGRLADLRSRPPVGVFLCNERACGAAATADQVAAVRTFLEGDPRVRDLVFESEEDAHAAFAELFADEPEVLDAVPPGTLAPSFRFDADRDLDDLVATLEALPGVDGVVDSRDAIAELEDLLTRPWDELAALFDRVRGVAAVRVSLCADPDPACEAAASDDQVAQLRRDLDVDERITDLRYRTAEENRAQVRELFEGADIDAGTALDQLGASFSFQVDVEQADRVRADYATRDGVADVLVTSVDDLDLSDPLPSPD